MARLVLPAEQPTELGLTRREEAQWSNLVAVRAQRLHLYGSNRQTPETIDVG
jgi:hypothetical protein